MRRLSSAADYREVAKGTPCFGLAFAPHCCCRFAEEPLALAHARLFDSRGPLTRAERGKERVGDAPASFYSLDLHIAAPRGSPTVRDIPLLARLRRNQDRIHERLDHVAGDPLGARAV